MRKESKALYAKALDSLVMSVDHFNRAWDRGRTEAVLILLDRAFELLLKAIIVHRAGSVAIRNKRRDGNTIGFDLCLRKCISEQNIKCIDEDDAVALQSLNTLRDAAQHYLIELSEEHLYVYASAGLSLFTRLAKDTLNRPLSDEIPRRILPVCAKPPQDLGVLFDIEFEDIKRIVAPNSRKRLDARAKLRSLAVLQSSLDGQKTQPSDKELEKIVRRIRSGEDWRAIFPGVATLKIEPNGSGIGVSLKITKNKGEAVQLVKEGDPQATVLAVRRVNELDYYSLGIKDISHKLKTTQHKLLWIIRKKNVQSDEILFKEIRIGRSNHKRYSEKCLSELRSLCNDPEIEKAYRTNRTAEKI